MFRLPLSANEPARRRRRGFRAAVIADILYAPERTSDDRKQPRRIGVAAGSIRNSIAHERTVKS
jgi:hypothetical protein